MQQNNFQKSNWFLFDMQNKVLGRTASKIANLLQGKNCIDFDKSKPSSNYVVVINAGKFRLTGSKLYQKTYYKHTSYLGHLKTKSVEYYITSNPSDVVIRSIKGMLPKNKLSTTLLKHLKVYPDSEHPHKNIKFEKEY